MHFDKLRDDWSEMTNNVGWLAENVGCIPLAVVIVTIANGMHRRFPEGIRNFFKFPIFTDVSRSFPRSILTTAALN